MCKRRTLFFFHFFLLVVSVLPSTAAPSQTLAFTPMTAAAQAHAPRDSGVPPTTSALNSTNDFDAQRAFAHNQVLAVTIGQRVTGSDGAARAGDYLAQQFQSYGYHVERQAFPFEAWEDHGTQVVLAGDASRTLEAQPIQYSPAGDVDAEVVAVAGIRAPEDVLFVDV